MKRIRLKSKYDRKSTFDSEIFESKWISGPILAPVEMEWMNEWMDEESKALMEGTIVGRNAAVSVHYTD